MNEELHICFLGKHIYYPWTKMEGTAVIARRMIKTLSDKVKLSLITLQGLESEVESINKDDRINKITEHYQILKTDPPFTEVLASIKKIEKEEKIDLFLLQNVSYFTYSWLLRFYFKKPVAIIETGSSTTLIDKIRHSIERLLLPLESFLITSINTYKYMKRPILRGKTHYIPPPIDTSKFTLPSKNLLSRVESFPWISNEASTFLYFGSLLESKFPPRLIPYLSKIGNTYSNFFLLIYAPDTKTNRRRTRKMAHRFKSHGFENFEVHTENLDQKKKRQLLNSSDFTFFPFEPHVTVTMPPLTILETMACGNLAIVPHLPALAPFLDEARYNLTFPPGDMESLTKLIVRLLEGNFEEKEEKIKRNARKILLKNFSLETFSQQISKLLNTYKSLK